MISNAGALGWDVDEARVAMVDLRGPEPLDVTYGDLKRRSQAVARGLVARGVRPGERVALAAFNRADFPAVLLGTLLAGAIAAPLNVKLPAKTLSEVIAASGARLAFVETAFAGAIPAGVEVIDFDRGFEDFLDFGDFEPVAVAPDAISMQPYTSGSTGAPKGVLLTHGGQIWAAGTLVEARRLRADDRAILAAPMYHKNAIVALKTALVSGSAMIVMPRFEAGAYARAIADHGVTMLTGVPTMMRLLLDHPELPDAATRAKVRVVSMGSSPASERLLGDLASAFPNAEIHLNYGTTEGGPIMFGWYHPDGRPQPNHSIGYPIEGCEWRLEGGATADEGELWVKNPGVAKGYQNRPEAAAERFIDGWYRTGDRLRRDAEGWFYFVSRIDDMMVTGGENVFPQEVEGLLERHPAVRQAAVIAVPNETKGEVPVAFVVLRPGPAPDEAALKAYAIANGPAYAHPRRVLFVDSLPLNGANKIDKSALKELFSKETTPR
ncbi:class I adenylate-forming enzyme family protein [Hansschlegelia plantiphila]|uniref:Acid--CoA ligase n=1 Tax=Hansschlegelia plantiphila TaxID=374655 RepID=A0A9W6J285_9HYPH|nr:class I adenylate-forming enzyme family protein [Hansschlegelia plantiphila]GLK68388.1 acid--CoA ligase [Hansschlegelia plantiphila]